MRDPAEPVARLMERARHLGTKLGPVLLQLPPDLRADTDLLATALSHLPPSVRVATSASTGVSAGPTAATAVTPSTPGRRPSPAVLDIAGQGLPEPQLLCERVLNALDRDRTDDTALLATRLGGSG